MGPWVQTDKTPSDDLKRRMILQNPQQAFLQNQTIVKSRHRRHPIFLNSSASVRHPAEKFGPSDLWDSKNPRSVPGPINARDEDEISTEQILLLLPI